MKASMFKPNDFWQQFQLGLKQMLKCWRLTVSGNSFCSGLTNAFCPRTKSINVNQVSYIVIHKQCHDQFHLFRNYEIFIQYKILYIFFSYLKLCNAWWLSLLYASNAMASDILSTFCTCKYKCSTVLLVILHFK